MFGILAWWVGTALAAGLGALSGVLAVASYRRQYRFEVTVCAGSTTLVLWLTVALLLGLLDHR